MAGMLTLRLLQAYHDGAGGQKRCWAARVRARSDQLQGSEPRVLPCGVRRGGV